MNDRSPKHPALVVHCAPDRVWQEQPNSTPLYDAAPHRRRLCLVPPHLIPTGNVCKAKVAAAGIPKFGSLDKLLGAYATIHEFFDANYKDLNALRKYWGYLANNVVFIQISTDVSSALKIFETINERGVGLNSMDLLKNLLFTQVKPEEFTRLKDE
jgi:uncharacterized protein DUF262